MLVSNLSFKDYKALPGWGSGDLKSMRMGPPARVLWDREHPRKDTDATILGTAAHCAILEPDRFDAVYVQKPAGMEYRSTENKAWRDDHLAAGRVILAPDVWAHVQSIAAAFYGKPTAYRAADGALGVETSMTWKDAETSEECKGRPDFYDYEAVYDLKVTRDAGPRLAFKAYINGWFHQLAHYRSGLNANGVEVRTGRIIAIHPDAPHYVHCIEARIQDLDVMALENENTLKAMRACGIAGEWPGTPDTFERVEIPQYALQEAVATAEAEEVSDGI